MDSLHIVGNAMKKPLGQGVSLADFSLEAALAVRTFHRSFSEYVATPLVSLDTLARAFGLGHIVVKDESKRFGLNAFKVLGGSYAIGRILADRLGRGLEGLSRESLSSSEVRKALGSITFVTATDGNHGRGVAWTAQQLGQQCTVFMPKGSAPIRVENIRATGAKCIVTSLNYDDTVRMASAYAHEKQGVLVQDTAWEGYEDIPRWIMQGYITLADEALEQMKTASIPGPTHIFLQAGVGSFAGAVLGVMLERLGGNAPVAILIEPETADCHYRSFSAADYQPHAVQGDLSTIMAGLACGEPSTGSWGILRDYASAVLSCTDEVAATGMRILAAPLPGDPPVLSGESGAVGAGVLEQLMLQDKYAPMRTQLGLDSGSSVLLVSTEGDTSPDFYRDIVWRGKAPALSNCAG